MEQFIKSIKPDTTPYDTFRDRVMRDCLVSRQTFYNWEHGQTVDPKYKPVINRIATEMFGKPVFTDEEKQSGCPTCPVSNTPLAAKGFPAASARKKAATGANPARRKEANNEP